MKKITLIAFMLISSFAYSQVSPGYPWQTGQILTAAALNAAFGVTTTHASGALNANNVLLGNGGGDIKAMASGGSSGQVLTSSGSGLAPIWAAQSGLSNPMTNFGDMIYGVSSGSPQRLPIGSTNQVLTVNGGLPVWMNDQYNPASVNITGGSINGTTIGGIAPSTGAFTSATANTPAQLDSSNNVATTAYVYQQSGNYGGASELSTNTLLTTSSFGQVYYVTSTGTTITLPTAVTQDVGQSIVLNAHMSSGNITITTNDGSLIYNGANVSSNTITLSAGQSAQLTINDAGIYVVTWLSAFATTPATGGNYSSSQVVPLSTTLTTSSFGNAVLVTASGQTISLPSPPSTFGQSITISAYFTSGTTTVNINGGGLIYGTTGAGTSTVTLNAGDIAQFTVNSAGVYNVQSLSLTTAKSSTNLAGGAAHSLPYQSGASTTIFISPVNGAVLNTNSSGVPSETAQPVLGVNATTTGTIGLATSTASGATTTIQPSSVTSAVTVTLPASSGTLLYSGGALGTPSSGVATNLTGTASGLTAGTVTTNANLTGVITSSGNATSTGSQTGTGSTFVMQTSPTFFGTTILGSTNAGGGLHFTGSATLSATNTSTFSFETPVTRFYVGDGTGYSMAFSKRVGSVTTDNVIIADTATASSSTTTGTMTISGGLGLTGAINAGAVSTAATPSQFDSSTKIATTAFATQQSGNYSQFVVISTGTTLTTANFGGVYYVTSGNITLPTPSSSYSGQTITVLNASGGNITVLTNNSSFIYDTFNLAHSSITMLSGQTISYTVSSAGLYGMSSATLIPYTSNGSPIVTDSSGDIYMPYIGSSSAATTGTLCWTTSSGLITVDTTTTCLLSSKKYKESIMNINAGLSTVMKLRPVSYYLKPEYDPSHIGQQLGLIAEEVANVDARLVAKEEDGSPHAVRYQQLTAVLVKAIQEQQKEIEELKRAIKHLVR